MKKIFFISSIPPSPSLHNMVDDICTKYGCFQFVLSEIIRKSERLNEQFLKKGEMISDEVIISELVESFEKQLGRYVLVGFPRTEKQLSMLESKLNFSNIDFEIIDASMIHREVENQSTNSYNEMVCKELVKRLIANNF